MANKHGGNDIGVWRSVINALAATGSVSMARDNGVAIS